MEDLLFPYEFEWDNHNVSKNWNKHGVKFTECEEVFFETGFRILSDEKHSQSEQRYFALGQTKENRYLFVVFTIRSKKIRVISARDMNKKERRFYEKIKENSQI